MFYVKKQIGNTIISTEIHEKNVFTTCRICGKEIQVDLNDFFGKEHFDLLCELYCDKCEKEYIKKLQEHIQQRGE